MKKKAILGVLIVVLTVSMSLAESPSWEEVDSRPTPHWWTDAKFGIFIHWGPYSVPAFSRVGDYAEWYWQDLTNPKRRGHEMVKAFHEANYGTGFTYPDFVPDFTCELFDPAQRADVFKAWGRPWSSATCGPERDLLGDLTHAVRQTGLKMGIYYSLYEWFNPLYRAYVDLFVEKHDVLKLTVQPDPGFATKEIFFTRKDDALYCICPIFPDDTLTVNDLKVPASAKMTLLGTDEDIPWRQSGENVEITVPQLNPSKMPCRFAWTFKIDKVQSTGVVP